MNRLLHFAHANGWSVEVKSREGRSTEEGIPRFDHATLIHVEGVDLDVFLFEAVRAEAPTGSLTFTIGGLRGTGARRRWHDHGNGRLEGKVPLIALGLLDGARVTKEREEERRLEAERWAQAERERREAQVRAAEERWQRQHLVAMVERHELAEKIRRLILAAGEAMPGEQLSSWRQWAEGVAVRLDPVTAPGDLVRRLTEPNEMEWLPPGWPGPPR